MPTSSPAQIEANRANAKLSTGPTTPEGKSASARNATKHGLTATRVILHSPADAEAFATLEADLRAQLQPAGRFEEIFFAQILTSAWNLERCDHLHVDLAQNGLDPLIDAGLAAELARIDNYYRRNERTLTAATKQLKQLQKERAYRECTMPEAELADPTIPALVPAAEVRSQLLADDRSRLQNEAIAINNHCKAPAGAQPPIELYTRPTGSHGLRLAKNEAKPFTAKRAA